VALNSYVASRESSGWNREFTPRRLGGRRRRRSEEGGGRRENVDVEEERGERSAEGEEVEGERGDRSAEGEVPLEPGLCTSEKRSRGVPVGFRTRR